MIEIECPQCGKKVNKKDYRFHRKMEEALLDLIKNNRPQWLDEYGSCPKWLANYKAMFCPN